MHCGTGRTKPGWTGVSKVPACLSVSFCLTVYLPACLPVFLLPTCLSASLSVCLTVYLPACLPVGLIVLILMAPLPSLYPTLPSPSSLRYVDLRLCSSPTVTRATYEYDTSLLNGYQTARSKKELSKFSVSNCQERGKEEVREEVREEGEERRGGEQETKVKAIPVLLFLFNNYNIASLLPYLPPPLPPSSLTSLLPYLPPPLPPSSPTSLPSPSFSPGNGDWL